jgi:hypothetical protein
MRLRNPSRGARSQFNCPVPVDHCCIRGRGALGSNLLSDVHCTGSGHKCVKSRGAVDGDGWAVTALGSNLQRGALYRYL